jgi:hypothetical protein
VTRATRGFGPESVFVATRLEGVLVHVLGEPEAGYPPAAITGQQWTWRAYGGPSAERRERAARLRAGPEVRTQPLDDPDGPQPDGPQPDGPQASDFEGLRTPEGWFLLARDGEGWYVVAERRATPDARSDEAIYAELRRAVSYVRARVSPVP